MKQQTHDTTRSSKHPKLAPASLEEKTKHYSAACPEAQTSENYKLQICNWRSRTLPMIQQTTQTKTEIRHTQGNAPWFAQGGGLPHGHAGGSRRCDAILALRTLPNKTLHPRPRRARPPHQHRHGNGLNPNPIVVCNACAPPTGACGRRPEVAAKMMMTGQWLQPQTVDQIGSDLTHIALVVLTAAVMGRTLCGLTHPTANQTYGHKPNRPSVCACLCVGWGGVGWGWGGEGWGSTTCMI